MCGVNDVTDMRLDLEAMDLRPLIRASVHYFNTEAEVTRFVELIRCLVSERHGRTSR